MSSSDTSEQYEGQMRSELAAVEQQLANLYSQRDGLNQQIGVYEQRKRELDDLLAHMAAAP